ncbi:unnamed protein product [Urochloa humidicola]
MARHHLLPMAAILAAVAAAALLVIPASGYPWPVCGGTSSFNPNSAYQANLNLLAATLPKNASDSPDLFATAVVGRNPDQIRAMALCRGDSNASICLSCLTQAFRDLPNDCSYDKDAAIYYDPCIFHYSAARALPGGDDTSTSIVNFNANVTSNPDQFERLLAALINATAERAASNNSARRFATGEADFDREFPRVYALAQCTPDLTPAQCRKCLASIVAANLGSFGSNIGGRVLALRCNYRYEIWPFFNGPAMVRMASPISEAPAPAPAPALAPSVPPAVRTPPETRLVGGRKKYSSVAVVIMAVALPTLIALNLVACLCFWRRRRPIEQAKQPYDPMYSAEAEDMDTVESMMIDVSTLRTATGDFDESNKLGEGGFGSVYKGILPDGDEIAVKRLSRSSTQGVDELKNELALVAKLKHKNLVRLVGVCLEQQERLLVYEFVPNRSLDLILFDTGNEKNEQLDWGQRYKIINGIARGLQYLHEDSQLKVVHRDLKVSNILLDANMNPKISDFGLARIFGRDQTQAITSRVVGTYGYMAPEYLNRGNYSVKSDAFSFGVMVLEIVTGRKNNSDGNKPQQSGDLLTTVWEHWEAGTAAELVDPRMTGSFPVGDVLRCVHIGLLCVQGDPVARPVMSSVVMMLGSETVTLPAPSKPAFIARNNGTS